MGNMRSCKNQRRSQLIGSIAFLAASVIVSLVFLLSSSILNASYIPEQKPSPELRPAGIETVRTGSGVKSVVISPDGSKVYSMNLEEMSVYEFDRASRKLLRKLVFIPHAGTGFDYKKNVCVDSCQEKPVEGHITHNGRYLWVSLHNGKGVVVWDLQGGETWKKGEQYKDAWLYDMGPAVKGNSGKRMIRLLWLKTGRTPKVITSSPDGRYLFVAHWHSSTVSVYGIDSDKPAEWRKIKDLATGWIPRGLAVSPDSKYLYVAQMGGSGVSVVDLASLKKVEEIRVGSNPRHIVTNGRFMYVSLNAGSKIAMVDLTTRKVTRVADTGKYPRTIAISRDGKTLFVVCYQGDMLQAFSADSLKSLGAWKSPLHPVGVDLFEDGKKREVWVGNYSSGTIKIFSFPVKEI